MSRQLEIAGPNPSTRKTSHSPQMWIAPGVSRRCPLHFEIPLAVGWVAPTQCEEPPMSCPRGQGVRKSKTCRLYSPLPIFYNFNVNLKIKLYFCISISTPWPDGVVFPLMQLLVEMVPAQRLHVPGHRTKARWRARRPARRPVRWGDRPVTSMAWPRPRWYADLSWSNSCHSGRPSKKWTCSWKPTTWTTNRRHEMIGPPSDRDVQCYTSLKPRNPSVLYCMNVHCQEKPSFIGIWFCLQFQFLDVAQEFFPHQELIAPKFLTECTFQTLTIDSAIHMTYWAHAICTIPWFHWWHVWVQGVSVKSDFTRIFRFTWTWIDWEWLVLFLGMFLLLWQKK